MHKSFYKGVIYCSNPLKGFYRFEDKFQIYPLLSEAAPKHDKVKLYPVVIEYNSSSFTQMEVPEAYKEYGGMLVEHTSQINFQKQIRSLLSALTNYRFDYPTPSLQWFTEIPSESFTIEDADAQRSRAGLNYFYYPKLGAENQISAFTDTGLQQIKYAKHPDCFKNLDLEGIDDVVVSEHIDSALHHYFTLNAEAKEVVDSAALLICNGVDLRLTMKSLSFTAFVSSVETMANYEHKDEVVQECAACKSKQYRVMGKFRDYLFKFAAENSKETKKQIIEIYKLRSNIVHAGTLLLGDNKIDWSNDKQRSGEWQNHLNVMQISRTSLMNWLLTRQ